MQYAQKFFMTGCAAMLIVQVAMATTSTDSWQETFTGGADTTPVATGQLRILVEKAPGRTVARDVQYQNVEGFVVVEGDMVFGKEEDFQRDGRGTAITGQQYRWPGGVVPYEMDRKLSRSTQAEIAAAMDHWQTHTAIRFVRRTVANRALYPDYVWFRTGTGCSAHVGRLGGKQSVWLHENCSTGNTIHEIGHALGLWHEQSREDRDQFVTIVVDNILPESLFNFDKHISDGDDIAQYDYDSIMHYGPTAFSKNGQPTIVPRDPNATIGQRNGLSQGDISTIQTMYNGGGTPSSCRGQSFEGSLSRPGEWQWEPRGNYYFSQTAGRHAGQLTGPSGVDFDLFLYQWDGSRWVEVRSSTQSQASESIQYDGRSGYYIWGVYAYAGQGTYRLCLSMP